LRDGLSEYVVGKPGRLDNLYPVEQRPEQKIDSAATFTTPVGRATTDGTAAFQRKLIFG
jgi:hypothetical protein